MSLTPKFLSVKNLSVSFRTEMGVKQVLHDVSFDVYKGKTTAIVGESGSGKSVSSLSLMQLLKAGNVIFDGGEFFLKENKILPGDKVLRALRGDKIAMIFQEPMTSLNPVMRVGEQVAETLRLHRQLNTKQARARVLELFKEVKLPRPEEMLDQYPHQLSGGQRQRVMIAMAIANEPELLIADEPTTALDVTVQKAILDLLKELQQRYNMSMIFITHDLGVVKEIAHHIVVMQQGRVIEKGLADDILNQPKEIYTKGLMACRPVPGKKIARLLTIEDFTNQNAPQIQEIKSSSVFEKELIRVDHITKRYISYKGFFKKEKKEVLAVNDVSFKIYEGEALGLVGESGCGKTTLSRILLGLIPTSEGSIIYKGNDLTKMSAHEWKKWRKELQIIFQDPYSALNPKHSIRQILTEPMLHHGIRANEKDAVIRAKELLEKVGMTSEALDKYPHEFSGGQRQRIVIARALSVEPRFIICDESVAALDVSVQAQVLNLLTDLKREFGLTYLFISHDLSVVYQMCDRIMVMNRGRIEELNTAENVFHHSQSEYTRSLLEAIPR
jgi:peptide/nickel transport system ATP-binding protein